MLAVGLRAPPLEALLDGDGEAGGVGAVEGAVVEGDGEAQCTIKMAASDYVDMMEGRAQGQALFFMGKLQIEGDMGLAMKLQSLTEMLA